MTDFQVPQTITVDNETHQVSDFSPTVQRLIEIHTRWRRDQQEEQAALAKTTAAIRSVEAELTQHVKDELAAKAGPAAEVQDNGQVPAA